MIAHGKDSLSLDLVSFSLILAYSSKESCLPLLEEEALVGIMWVV